MKSITIPGTNTQITEGSIVILSQFPNTKWIVHNDWYTYMNRQFNGWYLSSIPAQTIQPINKNNLRDLTLISNNCPCPPGPTPPGPIPPGPCPPWPPKPIPPGPGPMPPNPMLREVVRYFGGTNYRIGQLVFLKFGEIYQAATSFRSSWRLPTLEANMQKDIQSGLLVPVGSDYDIEELKQQMQEVESQVADMQTSVDNMQMDVNDVKESMIIVEAKMEDLETTVGGFDGRITTVEASMTTLESSMSTLETTVNTFDSRITTLESSVTTIEASITTIQNDITTIEGNITTIEASISSLETDVAGKVDKDVAGVGGTIVMSAQLSAYTEILIVTTIDPETEEETTEEVTSQGLKFETTLLSLEDGTQTVQPAVLIPLEDLGFVSTVTFNDLEGRVTVIEATLDELTITIHTI